MKKYLDFSQEFGKVDEELIAEAGKPWTIKRGDIFRLYRRKIGQAAAILLAFITVAGNSHVQAAVKEFTTKIGELMGFSKDLSAYTEVINQVHRLLHSHQKHWFRTSIHFPVQILHLQNSLDCQNYLCLSVSIHIH